MHTALTIISLAAGLVTILFIVCGAWISGQGKTSSDSERAARLLTYAAVGGLICVIANLLDADWIGTGMWTFSAAGAVLTGMWTFSAAGAVLSRSFAKRATELRRTAEWDETQRLAKQFNRAAPDTNA